MVTATTNETESTKKGENTPTVSEKTRKRKTEKLSKEELSKFRKKVDKEQYLLDAVEKMSSTDKTVKRIYKTGLAAPESIQKARQYIN